MFERDPLELIRYAETECHEWFDANSKTSDETQPVNQTSNILCRTFVW